MLEGVLGETLEDLKIWEAPPILTDFEALERTPLLFKKGEKINWNYNGGYTDTPGQGLIFLGKVVENLGETITGDYTDEELFSLLLELMP